MAFECLSELCLIGCKFLKEVPDISGAINLRELYLDNCKNLVEVHDSLGFLHKLDVLSFIGCTNLSILPCHIMLPSLEELFLHQCSSLRNFPNILGPMEYMRGFKCQKTSIEELPLSFGNLIGLESLVLTNCNWLHHLPFSIFNLPKLERLTACNCGWKANLTFGQGEEQERVISSVSSSIIAVTFENCNLPNQLLSTCLPCLPNLRLLSLNQSKFTILPACISECRLLKSLILDNCSSLKEIRGIPPNIKHLSATNCISLTNQS